MSCIIMVAFRFFVLELCPFNVYVFLYIHYYTHSNSVTVFDVFMQLYRTVFTFSKQSFNEF